MSKVLMILLAFMCVRAYASQDTSVTTMDEVEVLGVSRSFSVSSSVPVQRISSSDFNSKGISELSDVFKRMSGVMVKDYGGIGGLKSVSVRSLGSSHTGVEYDGVQVSDCQSGSVDIGRFTVENLSGVALTVADNNNIFRSAKSYASSAMVSISTAIPDYSESDYHISGKLKGGSFGYVSPSIFFDKKVTRKTSASVLADFSRADGAYPFRIKNGNLLIKDKRLNSEVMQYRIEAGMHSRISDSSDVTAKVYYYDSERNLPGGVVFYNTNSKERLKERNVFGQVCYKNDISARLSIKSAVKFGWTDMLYHDESRIYPGGEINDRYIQQEFYVSGSLKYSPFRRVAFVWSSDYLMNGLNTNIKTNVDPERHTLLNVLAVKYSGGRLTASASALASVYINEADRGESSPDLYRLSPSVSVSFKPFDSNLWVRASFKDFYRVPTFNENYFDRVGSKNLRPERAKQFNAGLAASKDFRKILKNVSVSADAFYNKVDDKIVAIPKMFVWSMLNLGEVSIHGVDANLSASFSLGKKEMLVLSGNYSMQIAKDITDESSVCYGDQIPYTPVHSGGGAISFENRICNVSYNMTAVGNRYALPQNIDANKISPYSEHNLTFYRSFNLRSVSVLLRADVKNLLDEQYSVVRYYPMPGRNFLFSMTIKK